MKGFWKQFFNFFYFFVCFYSLEFCKTELTAIKRCFSGNGFIDAGSKWTAKTCRNQLKVSFIIAMEQKPLFHTRFVGGRKKFRSSWFCKTAVPYERFPRGAMIVAKGLRRRQQNGSQERFRYRFHLSKAGPGGFRCGRKRNGWVIDTSPVRRTIAQLTAQRQDDAQHQRSGS